MSKSKAIGTKAETAVARAAHTRGFPKAERHILKGSLDEGDVWLLQTGEVVVEVKGGDMARKASHQQVEKWLVEAETEREHAGAEVGFLVVQRSGVGEANAHNWWAYFTGLQLEQLIDPQVGLHPMVVRMTYGEALALLQSCGYGEEL